MTKQSRKVQAIESYKVHMSPDAELALKEFMDGKISPQEFAKRTAGPEAMSFEKIEDNREFTVSWEDSPND